MAPQIGEIEARAREIIIDAKDEALRIRRAAEDEVRKMREESSAREQQLLRAEAHLEERQTLINRQQDENNQIKARIDAEHQEIEEVRKKAIAKLEEIAKLSKDQAKEELFDRLDKELSEEMAKRIRDAEEKAKEEVEEKSREILVEGMRHGATDYVAEYTVSTVKLPDEEMKGRIIGKEGRNIRSFERATGVDVDLDETPGEVRLSSFDSIRREVARVTLTRLIADGRIQPSRIEEFVEKTQRELERTMFEEGKRLCHEVKVYNLPRELVQMLGRFKYRFSYGQNMIAHTLEETKIGVSLAQEVGVNVNTVRLGCLLHDIGKVVTDEEGSHVELGVKLLKKYQIPQMVIDTVEQHHEDVPISTVEAAIVYIADAISGSRPGARYEDYEEYVKRLTKLEEIATSFPGVKEAYAIQAGREIRVLVNPQDLSDTATEKLAHDLKLKIEKEMTYPGTVKVTVIREVRASDVAK
ncbi:MAG: ribonuclease Y [Candidatus Chisholmbacteria bacterium RIFCSPHIGHO2_01_FULL_49_18]|uniref:Ribonuclease Y n=2 Tax=Candidatus Chisholmiibacteriota TaxID=1817900 RepID=A0A1G1VPR7_9BACT|nr:MAG: ribonuclease Y [Candidatus Chisholmbacteria bacterium RIFCSPHIGHO2_01_FULL_49_18]OGY20859.1 MAG: ribonuclease Y [Candidatus Chisholmbacteria bacterium RIFCSPLOWO2_01_FULL_49_14]